MSRNKVAYSCFVDSNQKNKFERESLRLIWSLMANIQVSVKDIYITCDQGVRGEYLEMLKMIGIINIALVNRFSKKNPPSNKWLQLDAFDFSAYKCVVVNDCDKVYCVFDDSCCDDSVRAAKFIAKPTFSIFEDIFMKYDLGKPRFFTGKPVPNDPTSDSRHFVNNHNGGLISIPVSRLKEISSRWKYWIDILHDDMDVLKDDHRNLDQVAFSLLMHDLGIDINYFPKSVDIGLGVRRVDCKSLFESGQLILHVHGKDDSLGLMCPSDAAHSTLKSIVDEMNKKYLSWLESMELRCYLEG